jgi:sugar phosphate isomerase/epimerase
MVGHMMVAPLKQQYPFRLGTTSFIYAADYVTNVQHLASFVDEIELLLFESQHLPPSREIARLADLANTRCISYNVHLPMDLDMVGESADVRRRSIDAVARAIDCVTPLSPTTHTLHLTFNRSDTSASVVRDWQDLATESVTDLLRICDVPARNISIETLDYDPRWLRPIVERLDLAICVDVGHVMRYGFNLRQVLDLFADRTTILHLHGVAAGKDHLALTHLSPYHHDAIASYLIEFKGSASIEVFNRKRLMASLAYFPLLMHPMPRPIVQANERQQRTLDHEKS